MKLDTVIVLGGALFKGSRGIWRTTNFDEGDGFGLLGDRLRVVAASYIYRDSPSIKIIASGGKDINQADSPLISEIIKSELIQLGVNDASIIEEPKSNGTLEQLRNSLELIRRLRLSRVGIISNDYHLPRIKALIKYGPGINFPAEMISAESVLIEKAPIQWERQIKDAYASEGIKKRIALEQKGIADLIAGKYKFR